MTYDQWKTTDPNDPGAEPPPPITPEEECAEAWEYWHQRAVFLDRVIARYALALMEIRTAQGNPIEIARTAMDDVAALSASQREG